MRVRERSAVLTRAELDAVLEPRSVVVDETADGTTFHAADGQLRAYRRVVSVEELEGDRYRVHQRVEFDSGGHTGLWDHLFGPLFSAHLGRLGPLTKPPFWYPPDHLDGRATAALARISTLALVLGYASILLSQSITYAAEEFGANKAAQGLSLAAVRADVLLALPLAVLADRRGRRWLAVNGTLAACVCTALGALAPSLWTLTGSQVVARGATNACLAIVAVMLAEEMPAGARAWATSIATMAGGLGGGMCVLALPLADIADGSWRVLYVIPLLFVPLVLRTGRGIEETHRFVVHAEGKVDGTRTKALLRNHRGRFVLLAGSALLLAVFATPASQFQNEFLRTERGFNGAEIAAFITITSTPGALGIYFGGVLAERGRRVVGAIATFAGVGCTVLQYWSFGALIYVWSTVGSILGGAAVPALGVYGSELFPTEARGSANGGIGLISRIGSVVGLVVAGLLADRIGLTRSLSYLAIGPALLTILILVAYPETAHKELEDLNPEDKETGGV